MKRIINTGGTMQNNSVQELHTWASTIEPNQQIKPADLLPGGSCAPPREAGIEVVVDAAKEVVRLFRGEHGAFVKTLSPWGGEFRVMGIDLLEGLREVCRVGYPSWRASTDERKMYLLTLLADAEAVIVPARGPMSRSEMEVFIDRDAHCQRAVASFTEAVDAAGGPVTDSTLRDFIARASSDPDAAIAYYQHLRAGRMGVAIAPAKPARRAQPALATAGEEA